MRSFLAPLISALLGVIAATALCGQAQSTDASISQATAGGTIEGRIVRVDAGATKITLILPSPLNERELSVSDPAAKEKLTRAQAGDSAKVNVDDTGDPQRVIKLVEIDRPVSRGGRIIALGLAFMLLFLIATAVTRGQPFRFLIGADNRYSNSQCQLALWFGAVATVYLAAVGLRIQLLGSDFIGGVGLPENLVALTGLSAFTFGGAKVITAQKVDAAERAGRPPVKTAAAKANILTDLVQNDFSQADLGDFQMILITLIAAIIFVLSAFHFLGALALEAQVALPDIDSTLLSGFGLGQGAYLIKKAALKAGEG